MQRKLRSSRARCAVTRVPVFIMGSSRARAAKDSSGAPSRRWSITSAPDRRTASWTKSIATDANTADCKSVSPWACPEMVSHPLTFPFQLQFTHLHFILIDSLIYLFIYYSYRDVYEIGIGYDSFDVVLC